MSGQPLIDVSATIERQGLNAFLVRLVVVSWIKRRRHNEMQRLAAIPCSRPIEAEPFQLAEEDTACS